MSIFEKQIDFLGKRKMFYIVSASLFALSIISLLVRGLQFGIDFKGGTEVAVQFEKQINIGEIRNDLNTIGLGNVEVKTFGSESGVLVRTEIQEIPKSVFSKVQNNIESAINNYNVGKIKSVVETTSNSIIFDFDSAKTASFVTDKLNEEGYQASKVSEDIENTQVSVRVGISEWIKENFSKKIKDNNFTVVKETNVGPKIGNELKRDALIAVGLSLLVIMIYLGFRFKFTFAVGAVVALFHDVFITLGFFSLLYGFIPMLNLEISISVVAAFLTLVGYSINDTVIVFDRIRENLKIHKTAELEHNMNDAINKTLRRTVMTSFTTIITVIVLLIFGGEVLRGFAFCLFFGITFGTYSSVFVASAFVLDYAKYKNQKINF
ncbi:MAG: protein translocase subunit SecF [bacterium]